jgi:hypothetical protein
VQSPEPRWSGWFIEAEKQKLTKNLTFNLRCPRNV